MTIDTNWLRVAKKKLNENDKLAAAVGYKKDFFDLNSNSFTIRKDKRILS